MTDDELPVLEVRAASPNDVASVDAVVVLVQSFASMVTAMKQDLLREIVRNAEASKERWEHWEADFRDYRTATDRRLEVVEVQLKQHLDREHDEDLVVQARIKPVATFAQLIARHWKTILLVVFVILGLLGFATETLRGMLGMVP